MSLYGLLECYFQFYDQLEFNFKSEFKLHEFSWRFNQRDHDCDSKPSIRWFNGWKKFKSFVVSYEIARY